MKKSFYLPAEEKLISGLGKTLSNPCKDKKTPILLDELFLAILYLEIEQKKHFTEMKRSTQLTPVLLKPLSMPVSKEVVLA